MQPHSGGTNAAAMTMVIKFLPNRPASQPANAYLLSGGEA